MSGEQANHAAPKGKKKVTTEDIDDELSKELNTKVVISPKTREGNEGKAQEQT